MKEISDKLRDFATFVENKKGKLSEYRDPLAEFVSFLDKIADKMKDIADYSDRVDFADEGAIIGITAQIEDMVNQVETSYATIKPLEDNLNELYHALLNSAIEVEQQDLSAKEEE